MIYQQGQARRRADFARPVISSPSVTGYASMDRMSTVPEDGALPTGPSRVNDYDSFAEAYAAENATSLANAYYERPAILALAGDVAGRRILDAGCGSGPLSAALRDRGAIVTGIDSSAGMLELARRRLGDEARLQQADLKSPLPFPDNAFDDVIASLVLHYLEDWTAPLAELRRVLTPGGRLIMSVNHPSSIYIPWLYPTGRKADYFATHNWTVPWTMGGQTNQMRFWHRPLHAMTDAFTGAGFRISVVSEPQPVPAARELFPDQFLALTTNPNFLFFVLHAD
jgi:ubiquinone/menaquinone biosynthesis C-methylase UbiE